MSRAYTLPTLDDMQQPRPLRRERAPLRHTRIPTGTMRPSVPSLATAAPTTHRIGRVRFSFHLIRTATTVSRAAPDLILILHILTFHTHAAMLRRVLRRVLQSPVCRHALRQPLLARARHHRLQLQRRRRGRALGG
mgnify:CR=1 FL=1